MMGAWLKFHKAAILTIYYGKNILLQTSYSVLTATTVKLIKKDSTTFKMIITTQTYVELKSAQLLAVVVHSVEAGVPSDVVVSCTETLGAAAASTAGFTEAGTSFSGIFSA